MSKANKQIYIPGLYILYICTTFTNIIIYGFEIFRIFDLRLHRTMIDIRDIPIGYRLHVRSYVVVYIVCTYIIPLAAIACIYKVMRFVNFIRIVNRSLFLSYNNCLLFFDLVTYHNIIFIFLICKVYIRLRIQLFVHVCSY